MKLNKILSITLLAGALMLSACGSKGNDNSGDSGSGGDSTPTGPVYTITETEYLLLKAKFSSPRIFIEGNFTMDVTFEGGSFTDKFDNGRFDGYAEGEHCVFDLQVDTYNASTKKATGDMYLYDEDDGWDKDTDEIDLAYWHPGVFYGFGYIVDSLEDCTYNEDTRTYVGTKTVEGETVTSKISFKDGQFLSIELQGGLVKYEFSNYGTTTVTLPELVG